MPSYVVLYEIPTNNGCCKVKIVGVFKYQTDAKECARNNEGSRIVKWYVCGM